MAKMKAVVLHGPDNYPNNYEVMEIEKPTCGENEILLKMKAAALCGTDKRIFTGGKRFFFVLCKYRNKI